MMKLMRSVLCAGAFLLITGCFGGRSPETHYYQLAPSSESVVKSNPRIEGTIVLLPIILPDYLKRVQVVSRISPYQLRVEPLHRWGGMLEENINRVVLANLEQMLPGTRIVPFGTSPLAGPVTRVSLQVQQFDGTAKERAVLDVLWQVESGDQLLQGHELLEQPVPGGLIADIVETQSTLLVDTCYFLAQKISEMNQ